MRAAVLGGRLQGVEATFLSQEAGWETVLVDREFPVPASGLCASFRQLDVLKDSAALKEVLKTADLAIPTLEDTESLRVIAACAAATHTPLAYDADSFAITFSKKRSHELFERLGVPYPRDFPKCGLPIIAKPSAASGSQGVTRISTPQEMERFTRRTGPSISEWVLQEYVEGPSYSIEVMGLEGEYTALQVTELEVDDGFDCKRVLAPATISPTLEADITDTALTIARGLNLKGIMDVEVIATPDGEIRVLEIDARLPSQTPTAVLMSTGMNMLEALKDIFIKGVPPQPLPPKPHKGVVYEHVRASATGLEFLGEHIMSQAGPLSLERGFCGADAALTDRTSKKLPYAATMMTSDENLEKALIKRQQVIKTMEEAISAPYPMK